MMDWTTPEGIAELLRLHAAATSRPHPGQRYHPDRHVREAGYSATAYVAAPALAAEVERLRAEAFDTAEYRRRDAADLFARDAEVEALRGLLADAGVVISDHLAESYPVLLDSIDAALAARGK